jgi:hypothetical protein
MMLTKASHWTLFSCDAYLQQGSSCKHHAPLVCMDAPQTLRNTWQHKAYKTFGYNVLYNNILYKLDLPSSGKWVILQLHYALWLYMRHNTHLSCTLSSQVVPSRVPLPLRFMVFRDVTSCTLVEAPCFSETSVTIYQTTWRHVPEDCNIDIRCSAGGQRMCPVG